MAAENILVVCSDLHCGSTVGLMPPELRSTEGNIIRQNKVQEFLWNAWTDAFQVWLPSMLNGDQYAMLVNGDLVEGLHHGAKQVISPEIEDHVEAAIQCLGVAKESGCRKLFITEGTECHTRNLESAIGKAVGAEFDANSERYAFKRLRLNISGSHVFAAHHMPTTSRPYLEASGHSIMMGVVRQESARSKLPIPDICCWAHRHRHGLWNDGTGISCSTGAFQASTRFTYKVVPAAIPQPSVIMFDWRNSEPGQLPQVYAKPYTALPDMEVVVDV